MNNFKIRDKVVLKIGNVPRTGRITDRGEASKPEHLSSSLAFYGENNFFAWLDNVHPYLTPVDNASA